MSQISKALKKVEEARQNFRVPLANDTYAAQVPVWDPSPVPPKNTMMIVGIVVSILISIAAITLTTIGGESKQNKVLSLEQTIKAQERRINLLTTVFNKTQKISDGQMRDLKLRLKKENNDMQSQIDGVASRSKGNYDSLKEAILDDKQEIDFLDGFTKKLNQKVEAMAVTDVQAANPSALTNSSM